MTVFLYSRLYCCLLLLLSSLSGVTAFATVPFNVISMTMTTSTMTSALTTATAAATTGGITNGVGTSAASILPSLFVLLDNEAHTNISIATVVGVASSVERGSVVEETAVITTTRQVGLINWDNPAESIGGAITLLYIVFSILAGIKYIVKDGWRPKM